MKKIDPLTPINSLNGKLLDAVIANDSQRVEELLAQGANPNCFEDKCEIRPLHFASVYNSCDVIFPLIKSGAKVDALTDDGYTPIDIANQLKHHKVSQILERLSANLVSFYDD